MIRGLHGLLYSSKPEQTRAFLRDKVKLPFTDTGGGWLIFDLPEGDLGVHPTEPGSAGGTHNLSFYCDDIETTVADLRGRGVEFTQDPQDHGYGYVTYFEMPGGITVQLYQPKYHKKQSMPERVKTSAKAAVTRVASAAVKAAARAGFRAAVTGVTVARGASKKKKKAAAAKARATADKPAKPSSKARTAIKKR